MALRPKSAGIFQQKLRSAFASFFTQRNRLIAMRFSESAAEINPRSLLPVHFNLCTGLSEDFSIELFCLAANEWLELKSCLGQQIELSVQLSDGNFRIFSGVVLAIANRGSIQGAATLVFSIRQQTKNLQRKIMMMNELDRRKVFWLLKKYSSYTAWKALGEAFQTFTDDWEYAVRRDKNADEDVKEFCIDVLKSFWNGCTGFDKGLPLLKRGERSVFRYNAHGYLGWHAAYAIDFAKRMMDKIEYVHDWMVNKEKVFADYEFVTNAESGLLAVTEREEFCNRAPLKAETVFSSVYAPFNFPALPQEIPSPSDIVVKTDELVPCNGIWEPEWDESKAREATNLFKNSRSLNVNVTKERNKGCMNYLLADTIAPTYQDTELGPEIPVHWRLIWEDTRYLDGTIPEEEREYLLPPSPASNKPNHPIRCDANQPCPHSGYWWTPAKQNSRRFFKQGEIMPDFPSSKYGSTIWCWEGNPPSSS